MKGKQMRRRRAGKARREAWGSGMGREGEGHMARRLCDVLLRHFHSASTARPPHTHTLSTLTRTHAPHTTKSQIAPTTRTGATTQA